MSDIYMWVLILSACALAFLSSCRIAYFMCNKHWRIVGEALVVVCGAAAVVASIIMGFISYALIASGGWIYGLAAVLFSIPAVGLAWLAVIGSNKAIERILSGLLSKV